MGLGEIVRMHEDLERSLKKPVDARSWIMVVDIRKCVGDHACAISCMAENVCSPGTSYRKVFETEFESFPETDRFFMPANCQQCDNPPCLKAADKIIRGAITKRKDGIVVFNYPVLIHNPKAGEAARKACPYYAIVQDDGGFYTDRTPVFEPYETRDFYEYDQKLNRQKGNTKGAIRKCTFCLHRLESGMIPSCVSTCIGRAMYFGDRRDPQSLVSELLKKEQVWVLKAELGTLPRIYYIGYENRANIAVTSFNSCMICHK